MSILCAVDFSRASSLALAAAGRIAATFDQPLSVMSVGDPLLAAAEQVASGDDPAGLLTRALGEFVDETLGAGMASRYTLVVRLGEPAPEILRQADALDAALVVLATQGTSGVAKFMFGSVAERVLRESTRPVLVVPPAVADGPMRTLGAMQEVLAPIDFHEHVADDARVASRIARASHARLRLLHVLPADDGGGWTVLRQTAAAELEAQLSGARRSREDEAREALEALGADLGVTPAPTLEIAHGSVPDQIAQVADRADVDLVVLGLRGVPGLMGSRVGAVAYRVLCASPAPVLAVPHEARGGHALAFLDRA
ncbi:MAG TPA: universal stress protein [Luteitalea sp.]|nr:universal stress protein [Luteitalea sp.]